MNGRDQATASTWSAIVNSGWFGVLVGAVLFIIGVAISIVLYRRSKPVARLRTAIVDQALVGVTDAAGPGRLELRFDGLVVPRVTSTSFGLWNDGTTTFRGSDVVEADALRLELAGEGGMLQATVERTSRSVNDVQIVGLLAKSATIGFDFLDPGDGFRLRVLHSGEPGDISLAGTIRGLPQGVSKQTRPPAVSRWLSTGLALGFLWTFGTMAVEAVKAARYASWYKLLGVGLGITLFVVVVVLINVYSRRAKKRRVKGVPAAISDDDVLYDRLTNPFTDDIVHRP